MKEPIFTYKKYTNSNIFKDKDMFTQCMNILSSRFLDVTFSEIFDALRFDNIHIVYDEANHRVSGLVLERNTGSFGDKFISFVAVSSDYKGREIGSFLVSIVKHVLKKGQRIILNHDDVKKLREFYGKLGFKHDSDAQYFSGKKARWISYHKPL